MTVTTDRRGPVAVIAIGRPERRNAVDRATAQALHDAFSRFEADEAAAVAVLTGTGGSFCAGADLKALAAGESAAERVTEEGIGPMGPTRMRLTKPVIAAVEGHAAAGGLELACWCDLRVAARSAVFGVFCRRFGVPLVDLGTVRLPRLIGHSRAMDMILTGRAVEAEEAHAMGLVNRLTDDGAALETAVELGKTLAALPQTCLRGDRLSAIEQWDLDWTAATINETRRGLTTLASGEAAAGAAAFAGGTGRGGGRID